MQVIRPHLSPTESETLDAPLPPGDGTTSEQLASREETQLTNSYKLDFAASENGTLSLGVILFFWLCSTCSKLRDSGFCVDCAAQTWYLAATLLPWTRQPASPRPPTLTHGHRTGKPTRQTMMLVKTGGRASPVGSPTQLAPRHCRHLLGLSASSFTK